MSKKSGDLARKAITGFGCLFMSAIIGCGSAAPQTEDAAETVNEEVTATDQAADVRINSILGQFDKFYETYDVDPESPYYVPEDKRLPIF